MKNKKKIIIAIAVIAVIAVIAAAVIMKSIGSKGGDTENDRITSEAVSDNNNSENNIGESNIGSESSSAATDNNGNKGENKGESTDSTENSGGNNNSSSSNIKNPNKATENNSAVNAAIPFENAYIMDGIAISPVFSFTGEYVEDGTNDNVKKIAAVKIKNTSDRSIEYMNLTVDCSDAKYKFKVITLPVGETVTVFESNRKKLEKNKKIVSATCDEIAYFDSKPTIYPDIFAIYPTEEIMTVKNISKSDINGDIYIYYKNFDENGLYGGITYRVKISGIKAGNTVQVPASHYSTKHSKVVFVSYAKDT